MRRARRRGTLLFVLLVMATLVVFALSSSPVLAAEAGDIDYARDIKPVLKERCYACHGALKQEAGLRLDTGALVRKGGDSGEVLDIGDPATSVLIERIAARDEADRMPPEGRPLAVEEIELFKRWIADGALSPADEEPEPHPSDHWAFKRPAVPSSASDAEREGRPANPIDAFVAAKLSERGLKPLGMADPHVLLRRVYLDLIGVPPRREELQEFLADPGEDAYENVVDRLLAHPKYGERWARHWMDVWRYSDWYGRRAVPDVMNSYPHIWRWRDWIVRSLNEDKGYDQLVREMLAADEVAPSQQDTVVATGFIVRNWYKWNYNQWMKDAVEHTGKAFLGITLNCCHCHDHKYDPLTQEEYFKFRAFFEPLELRHDRIRGLPDPGPFQKYVYGKPYGPIKAGAVRVFDEKLDAETFMYAGGDARNKIPDRPPIGPGVPQFLGGNFRIEPVELPLTAWYPGLQSFVQDEEVASAKVLLRKAQQAVAEKPSDVNLATVRSAEAELNSLEQRIAADRVRFLGAAGDAGSLAQRAAGAEREAKVAKAELVLAERQEAVVTAEGLPASDKTRNDKIKKERERVQVATESLTEARRDLDESSSEYSPIGPVYPKRSTGRRSALANWIVSRDQPLTARVAVNHIWRWHFGQPLVASTFNFGRSGTPPTHPRLLDWLAVEFIDSGWSIKKLHRVILTSFAYRRRSHIGEDSTVVAANFSSDPENHFLWRFRVGRMQAEVVRDSVLHITGQLDSTFGGQEIELDQAAGSRRRSLYFTSHGESKMQFLELFDAPNPCDSYVRATSVVPHQALALANSELGLKQACELAEHLWAGLREDFLDPEQVQSAFVHAAFEQVLTRSPSSQELVLSRDFLARQRTLFEATDFANLKKERVEADEARATTGTDPSATELEPLRSKEAEQRARESLVHVLLNHNDFVTIR